MKGTILRFTWSALILALILGCAGCSDKRGDNAQEELPTIANEITEVCETYGWEYDNPSQGEADTVVPGEGDKMIKDKFKESLKGKGIYIGDIKGEDIPFEARVIKTGSYTSGKEFPTIGLFRSVKDLGSIDTIDYGSKYDEEFFKTKSLIVIQLREGSGSIRHEVTKVVKNGDQITVQIKVTVPEFGTADMAEWAVLVEVDNAMVNDNTTVDFVTK